MFRRNARFSVKRPVPDLGTAEDCVERVRDVGMLGCWDVLNFSRYPMVDSWSILNFCPLNGTCGRVKFQALGNKRENSTIVV